MSLPGSFLPAFALAVTVSAQDAGPALPAEIQGWRATEPVKVYAPASVYDYMDGGAEVYLSYGLKTLHVRVYRGPDGSSITLNLFEMASSAAAFGVLSFERVDGPAGIGQDSEYGAGILRFWQGSRFVFIQADRESPACREAILALGRQLVAGMGPPGLVPALPAALPAAGLRPLSVRYVLTPQMLASMETIAADNALGLPDRCEAVVGRYGQVGQHERVIIARYADAASARKGLGSFLQSRQPKPWSLDHPVQGPKGWSSAATRGALAVLVLDAPDAEACRTRLSVAMQRLKEVLP
jgi:hypothetical protein